MNKFYELSLFLGNFIHVDNTYWPLTAFPLDTCFFLSCQPCPKPLKSFTIFPFMSVFHFWLNVFNQEYVNIGSLYWGLAGSAVCI